MKLTLEEIAKAVEGRLIGDNAVVTAVSTDTRTISNGALFIPLKGASFDGHKFIDVAVENGAVAVISQEEVNTTVPVIMVEDTHKALGDLARCCRHYRKYRQNNNKGYCGICSCTEIQCFENRGQF